MSQNNNCALKKIVNSPALWPASLQKPLGSVTSYVFKSQEHTQKFVKFMREKLPGVEAKVSRDDNGMYIVNLTNLTKGCKDGVNVGNYVDCPDSVTIICTDYGCLCDEFDKGM